MKKIHVDNLIIGGGLVGSITAWILAENGEKGMLLEKSSDPGGVNGSFSDSEGNWFDHGRHVILSDRSELTSDFFRKVVGADNVLEYELKRGIFIHGSLIPYAAELKDWPETLQDKISINPEHPGIYLGANRDVFTDAYGSWFAKLVFEEMLQAYPILKWKKENGMKEESLLDWIFPWFFPRTTLEIDPQDVAESGVYSDESRLYHYNARYANPPSEPVLYPAGEGGYAKWIMNMLSAAAENIELKTGLNDIKVDIDSQTLDVKSITSDDTCYSADRIFWCAPLPVLCRNLGWSLPKGEPQWELLGSFSFNESVNSEYHEILFADPKHKIRRINFPGLMSGNKMSRTLQVEFTTLGADVERSAEEWKLDWLDSLYQLGIVEQGAKPVFYDFKKVSRGIVSTENLGSFLAECEAKIQSANSNMIVPHMAVASDNNSRLVPKIFRCIEKELGTA